MESQTYQNTENAAESVFAKANTIFCEDCNATMEQHIAPSSVDIVLTSPPYCTSNRAGKGSTVNLTTSTTKYYPSLRYDVFSDNMTPEEYVKWTCELFRKFDHILKPNGCILYNISYSSDNRDTMFLAVADIVRNTNFTIAEQIIWKKSNALPNNTSSNKLTRIVEPVFVFCRKSEVDTFACNKKVVSIREKTGQKMYENIHNFIEARNNDGVCKLNRATYSSELCERLLGIYGKACMTVYDPFMGTGTTAVACKRLKMSYFGSEISQSQVDYANNRIAEDSGVPCLAQCDAARSEKRKKSVRRRKTERSEDSRFTQMELFDSEGKEDVLENT